MLKPPQERVGKLVVIQFMTFQLLASQGNHPARYPDHRGVGWDVDNDHRVGADLGRSANFDIPQHLSPGRDNHMIPQSGMPLSLFLTRPPQGDTLEEGDVIAYFAGLTDHRSHSVVDEKAFADGGAGMDFDSGQESGNLGNQPR